MQQMMQHHNSNFLSYTDYGDGQGFPILVQHGLIASIDDYHLFDSLINAGRRVICAARPGYGESSPYQLKNLAEWGEITALLVNELHLSRFDVLGLSSGALYGYAIGYALPDKARNLFVFSGMPALYDDDVVKAWPYKIDRQASLAELEQVAHDLFFSNIPEETLARADFQDSMRNNGFGVAQDLRVRCVDWGFTLSAVRQTVSMEHSRLDAQVPFITAELTAKLLPHCRLAVREGGEHFSEQALEAFINNALLRPA